MTPETRRAFPPGHLYLWVLRHAKAASGAPGGDHERPLTERGARDAAKLGTRLTAGAGSLAMAGPDGEPVPSPEVVLCSTAARTVATAALVFGGAGDDDPPPLRRERSLYGASAPTALSAVREAGDGPRSVAIVGHNPGLFHLAWELLDPENDGRDRLTAHGFPTCTLAVVALPAPAWSEVGPASGWLCGVTSPPY